MPEAPPNDGSDAPAEPRYGEAEGTTWPINVSGIEWKLRYSPDSLTREDELVLASVVHAYDYLRTADARSANAGLRRMRRAQPKTACEVSDG